jgi:hypothetical protein
MKTYTAAVLLAGIIIPPLIASTTAIAQTAPVAQVAAPVRITADAKAATLENGLVRVAVDLAAGTYAITDSGTGETVLAGAGFGAAISDGAKLKVESQTEITDELGKGRRLTLAIADWNLFRHSSYPASGANPAERLVTFTLHENSPALILGFGMKTPVYESLRVMNASPLQGAQFLPGKKIDHPLTLNGGAGADSTLVKPGSTRECANSLLLTGLVDGKRRSVVWGGLANGDFGKFVAVRDWVISATAEDPVGRLVPPGTTYLAPDSVYVDALTADPFVALERYGLAMRAATHAAPNVYQFPVLCGWSVGHVSHLPDVNNSAKLVEQLEAGNKLGINKYTKIGVRLEPDKYQGDSEQGWWDDAHWAKYGHLVPPYSTVASWCKAVTERDGVPYIYFQTGMPSDDYAKAFPQYMLFNDISALGKKHSHHQPYVTYDYTDKDFSDHVVTTWKRLRQEGIIGVKFDYPETAWRPEGGFDDRFATTTSAYRRAFSLVREGFGKDRLIDERNIGESGRPMLDITAGIVDTQRTWTDSNRFVPEMVSISGLRWYKNRTVFNYYPDTKTVHDLKPEIRRAMLTMTFLTSGRFDMATSYSLFTPEMAHDFTRVFPHYIEPKTARPVDAFTGVKDPQVYDLALTPDRHQVALFNTGDKQAVVGTALSGEVAGNALGLAPDTQYHAYEFWTDTYLGKIDGKARLERTLDPLNCAMISVNKAEPNPQVLSTNRHLLQGWVELSGIKWDASTKTLSGTAKVIGGESFKIVVANNGAKAAKVSAAGAEVTIAPHQSAADLSVITLTRADNGDTQWEIAYQ